jgi:hypothetical protein
VGDDFVAQLGTVAHDRRDPDQWWALYTDRSLPLDAQVKAALVLDARSFSRRVLLPLLRPLARTFLVLVGLFRTLVPRALTSSSLLHRLIHVGLRHFVTPQANFLILRHFHLGSNVIGFLAANSGTRVATLPLRPLAPADVKDHLFLQHDLNLYNFVISLNAELAAEGRGLTPPATVDFDAIDEAPIPFPRFPRGPFNFWIRSRRSSSTRRSITCCSGSVTSRARTSRCSSTRPWDLRRPDPRRHHAPGADQQPPPVGAAVVAARRLRLVLHGLGTEMLHAVLVQHKRAAASGAKPTGGFGLQSLWRGPGPGRGQGNDARERAGGHSRRAPAAVRGLAITAAGFLIIYFGVAARRTCWSPACVPRAGVGRELADRAPRAPASSRARSASRWSRSRSSVATARSPSSARAPGSGRWSRCDRPAASR